MTHAPKARPSPADRNPDPGNVDHLIALGQLMERASMDAMRFFDHGLALLVEQLGMEAAYMVRLTDLGLEVTWWQVAPDRGVHLFAGRTEDGFVPRVLDHPLRPLVIRDAAQDPTWRRHPAHLDLGLRAFVGTPLWKGNRVIGILAVQDAQPRDFTRQEIALVLAVANLMGKTLEVELLKAELHQTRDALDLTAAVVQDNALESSDTGIPNRHYLDIWLRANLYLARRRGEAMAVVRWYLRHTPAHLRTLKQIAERLRGEGLLVDLDHGQWLLLLPHTPESGSQVLLDRLREQIGKVPMGATIWNPVWNPDHEDMEIRHALRRAEEGLEDSQGTKGHPVVWKVPDPLTEGLLPSDEIW